MEAKSSCLGAHLGVQWSVFFALTCILEFRPLSAFASGFVHSRINLCIFFQVLHTAAKQELPIVPAGIIVANTFTSVSDMLDSVFPIFAYEFLKKRFLRLKWRNIDHIPKITVPMIMLSSVHDEIVPASHMLRLKVTH
jgi:hypothetical protein